MLGRAHPLLDRRRPRVHVLDPAQDLDPSRFPRAGGRGAGRRRAPFLARFLGLRQQLDHLLADPAQVRAEFEEHLRGRALALADQAEQDVLGADVVVTELERLPPRQVQRLLGPQRVLVVVTRHFLLWPVISSIFPRTASRLIPIDSRASAAIPSRS